MAYLLYLSTPYYDVMSGIEKHLPQHLSEYDKVFCFDHPQFLTSISNLISHKPLLKKISPSFYLYHSIGFLPFGRSFWLINYLNHHINYLIFKILTRTNNFWKQRLHVITFTPEIVYCFPKRKNIIAIYYYVTDHYPSLPQWSNKFQKKQFDRLEKNLFRIAKKVIVVSNTLFTNYRTKHNCVILFPTPSYSRLFSNFNKSENNFLPDLTKIPHPIAGFMGSYFDWKIDTKFLISTMEKYPSISFIFLGTMYTKNRQLEDALIKLPNCYYLGQKSFGELPIYVSNIDVCLIPYITNSYGHFAYPVKIMEYLAMGKPVVTTALPSIKYLRDRGLIYWSKDNEEFDKNILKALKEKPDPDLRKKRIKEALKNDWSVRIKQFIKLINE